MNNLEYIKNNYIEKEEICKELSISLDKLSKLIKDKSIPSPSYEIVHHYTISSPLGDSFEQKIERQYFPKNILELIKKQRPREKQEFKNNLLKSLEKHPYKSFVYKGIIDTNNNINKNVFDKYAEERWNYYMNGVYGICTHNVNPEEIVRKGIVVSRLQEYQRNNNNDLDLLKELNDEYNRVARDFAPYQRDKSSRGKYLDSTLKKSKKEKLIKNYR